MHTPNRLTALPALPRSVVVTLLIVGLLLVLIMVTATGSVSSQATTAQSSSTLSSPLPSSASPPAPWANQDIGSVAVAGGASYANNAFRIKGTLDIWNTSDGFHYVYQPLIGDGQIVARVTGVENTNPHAKAGVMIRETLAADARHATMVVTPVDGVQFLRRYADGGLTTPTNPQINKGRLPYWVKMVRKGHEFSGYESTDGNAWVLTGRDTLQISNTAYIGLVASSHQQTVLNTSTLDSVAITKTPQQSSPASAVTSHVTIISVDGKTKGVIFSAPRLFEAPNWSPDGKYLVLNSEGKLWRLPVAGGELQPIPLGSVARVNNDHGISPDGREIVVSANGGPLFILPFAGGEPRRITEQTPSYYHGWSPDGNTLAYVAKQHESFDIYGISVKGGTPARLTMHAAHEDGPDYSPDGKWVYFNSDRAGGGGDIWRIPASGAGENDAKAEQITNDDYVDWFPHPSPDGKHLVFLSYQKGTEGHPANKDVVLRMMPLPGAAPGAEPAREKIVELVKLFGGQGTLNVASWAPDSQRFAYVSYSLK